MLTDFLKVVIGDDTEVERIGDEVGGEEESEYNEALISRVTPYNKTYDGRQLYPLNTAT